MFKFKQLMTINKISALIVYHYTVRLSNNMNFSRTCTISDLLVRVLTNIT